MEEMPFDQSAMFAWAHLVGAIADTMHFTGAPAQLIDLFLDRLDDSNANVLRDPARQAYLAATATIRETLPGRT